MVTSQEVSTGRAAATPPELQVITVAHLENGD